MATLATGGRISQGEVATELGRLQRAWSGGTPGGPGTGPGGDTAEAVLTELLGPERTAEIDRFDAVQLAEVVRVCRQSRSMAEAGRTLFAASRERRASTNDSDRVRKYLQRFELSWDEVVGGV